MDRRRNRRRQQRWYLLFGVLFLLANRTFLGSSWDSGTLCQRSHRDYYVFPDSYVDGFDHLHHAHTNNMEA